MSRPGLYHFLRIIKWGCLSPRVWFKAWRLLNQSINVRPISLAERGLRSPSCLAYWSRDRTWGPIISSRYLRSMELSPWWHLMARLISNFDSGGNNAIRQEIPSVYNCSCRLLQISFFWYQLIRYIYSTMTFRSNVWEFLTKIVIWPLLHFDYRWLHFVFTVVIWFCVSNIR